MKREEGRTRDGQFLSLFNDLELFWSYAQIIFPADMIKRLARFKLSLLPKNYLQRTQTL